MKRIVSLLLVLLLSSAPAGAWLDSTAAREDRVESPYFKIVKGSGVEAFPLKHTSARIQVTGAIANVVVTQEYANEGTAPIEASYVFPGSTRSAVHALTMTVAGRVRRAVIMEKKAAQVTYEKAKAEGKSAALLEQERANVFKMNVANVMPGERVVVELAYTELLVPREGVYELVFPTVVGPRYESAAGTPTDRADAGASSGAGFGQKYLPEGQAHPSGLTLSAALSAGTPVTNVASPSHPLKVDGADPRAVRVEFAPDMEAGANRDFILRWQLAGAAVETGLLAHEGKENTFLLTVEPPVRVTEEAIAPREYVFVVDTSGSMTGYPMAVTGSLLGALIGQLKPTDRFNVMTFSGGQELLAPASIPATRENVERAKATLARINSGGSTELLPALKVALAMTSTPGYSRSFIVITDGYVSCEPEAFRLVRQNLSRANVFAFGIGTSVNRLLIEGLARAGRGEPFVVTGEAEAPEAARALQRYIQRPLLTQVKVEAVGLDAYDLEPAEQAASGSDAAGQNRRKEDVAGGPDAARPALRAGVGLPDLLAERPLMVTGKWRGPRQGALEITALAAGKPWKARVEMASARVSPDHAALALLWARERIAWLSDLKLSGDSLQRDQILALGLKYGLLTEYTSFVAVDEVVRATTPALPVSQPLPLPAGVPQAATGAVIPTVPEPETWALLIVAALAGLYAARRPEARV